MLYTARHMNLEKTREQRVTDKAKVRTQRERERDGGYGSKIADSGGE